MNIFTVNKITVINLTARYSLIRFSTYVIYVLPILLILSIFNQYITEFYHFIDMAFATGNSPIIVIATITDFTYTDDIVHIAVGLLTSL